jgi:signal transduction histidine kinase
MDQHPGHRRLVLLFVGILALGLICATLTTALNWIHKPFPGFFLHENLTVAPYFLPGWTGGTAGIKPLDRVLTINEHHLTDREQAYELVRAAPVAAEFRYLISREGRHLRLTVRSMQMSFQHWFLAFGISMAVGVCFLLVGAAPYYHYASSPAALPLCAMVVAVFAWFGTIFDFVSAGNFPKELRFFGLTLTPITAIHMALILKTGGGLRRIRPRLVGCIYAIGVVMAVLNSIAFFGPLDGWIGIFRLGYIYLCGGAVVFLLIIASALRAPVTDLERSRLRVMLAGAFLGFLLPTSCAVLASSFQWSIPYNLALVPTVFFPLSMAYALLKYSLFDLGNALKLAISRLVLTALLLAIYGAMAFLLVPWAGADGNDPLVPLFFSVVVVACFNPLLRRVERAVSIYIYGQDYDTARVQSDVSLFLRSLSSTPLLSQGFINRVAGALGIQNAALAYRPTRSANYVIAGLGEVIADAPAAAAGVYWLWSRGEARRYDTVSRSEVMTSPAFQVTRNALLAIFERWQAEVLIPVVFEQEIRGFVALGKKESGREYSADDLRLLVTLTDQLALSLENGRLFEESEKSKEEYRRLYREAELAKQKLVETDRIKKHFVANICHELRTPVSTIIGYGEVLLDPAFRGDSRLILERLVDNGQGLSLLMDNLLNFSRMEAGGVFTEFEMVDLDEIMAALDMMSRRIIRGRPIDFRVSFETELRSVRTDPKKLQQILVNLLTNALKFTERGSIEITVETVFEQARAWVEIAVSDTGIGIQSKDLELIFEDFRQLDGSSTRHYGGTGVGLSVCKKIAESIGGTLRVVSDFGIGSRFSLLIPVDLRSGSRHRDAAFDAPRALL